MKKIIKSIFPKQINSTNIKKGLKILKTDGIREIYARLKKINNTINIEYNASINNLSFSKKDLLEIAIRYLKTGSMSTNVVFTTPCLSYGGGELYTLNLAKAIHNLYPQYNIYIVVPEFIGECKRDLHGDYSFINVVPCRDFLEANDLQGAYDFLKTFISLAKPQILHNINSVTAWNLLINEPNYVKQNVGKVYANIFCEQYDKYGNLEGFAKEFLEKGLPHLDYLFSDNANFKTFAQTTFKLSNDLLSKILPLYTPVKYNLTNDVTQAQNKYAQINDLSVVKLVWIARMDDQKNVVLLYEIARQYPEIIINVYGSKLIDVNSDFGETPSNIFFKGIELNIAKIMLDDDYTAMIMTSKYEGIPTIIISCGFLNVPIIVPDVGGISDIINEDTGYLLSNNPSPEEYFIAIQDVINNPQKRLSKSKKLLELINTRHSMSYLEKSLVNLNYIYKEPQSRSLPLVSVIIPCYNQYQFLLSCIESVYSAYCGPLEIIVIDDCSTDNKKNQFQFIISKIYPAVKFINNEINLGLAATRNVGIEYSSGEYIQFLDSDDILLPNKILTQILSASDEKQAVMISDYYLSDNDMSSLKYDSSIKQFDLSNLETFLIYWERGFCIPIHVALFGNNIKTIRFKDELPAKEDWFFWISLIKNGFSFRFIDTRSAIYRMNNQSMTNSKFIMSGKAWVDVCYFVLDYLSDIDEKLKSKFMVEFSKHYTNWYIPNSIKELSLLNQKIAENQIVKNKDEFIINSEYSISDVVISNKKLNITILIPIFNHYEYLWQCIKSALEQTNFSPIEILLLNDNSSDERVAPLLEKITQRYSNIVKLVNFTENQGISNIQNYGIKMAKGDYIAFLDCDDYLEPNALKEISEYVFENKVDYLFTDNYHVREEKQQRSVYGGYQNIKFTNEKNIYNDLLDGMVANHLKVIKVSAITECGFFDINVTGVQDWDLALKFCEKGFNFKYIAKPLYNHRIHKNSVTNSMQSVQFKLMNIIRRKNVLLRYPHIDNQNFTDIKYINHVCDLSIIHQALQDKQKLVFKLNDESLLVDYWFINEFNSYFDEILISDGSKYALICGYLWSYEIVRVCC